MKYEEWRKLAVIVSDLRPFDDVADGYDFWRCTSAAAGALFMQRCDNPKGPDEAPTYHNVGIIQQLDNGMWSVIVSNMNPAFGCFEQACRWLWDNHWKYELDNDGPQFKLIGVDTEGVITHDKVYDTEWRMMDALPELLGDEPNYYEQARKDLAKVGARYFEFSHGHFVAFPLEDM